VYIKFKIHFFAPSLLIFFDLNEISYIEVVRSAGEKLSAFFWAILYILSQLGKKYHMHTFNNRVKNLHFPPFFSSPFP